MHNLPPDTRALCTTNPHIFDSTNQTDHEQAATLCNQCPSLEACKTLPRDPDWRGTRAGGATYEGTLTKVDHQLSLVTENPRTMVVMKSGEWRHVKTYPSQTPIEIVT